MGRLRALVLVALVPLPALAAETTPQMVWTGVAPSGACTGNRVVAVSTTGAHYCCIASTWTACGASYTLPAATASVLGGVKGTGSALVCSGTDKATGFAADGTLQCAADQGGGGGGNSVTVSLSLGDGTGLVYSTTVTGQAWVTGTSRIICQPQATTADGQTAETYYVAGLQPVIGNLVVGTGFDLAVTSPRGASGTYRFSCIGG